MSPQAPPPPRSRLSSARQTFLLFLLAAIVGGHLYCLVFGIEDLWPFGSYELYSESRDPDKAEHYVLVGVEATPSSPEIELFLTEEYLRPHYRATHHGTFQRLAEGTEVSSRLAAAAADCLRLYEERRRHGLHDGPPLVAARVYLYTWRYDAVNPTTGAPTSRQLLAEARLESAGAQ